MDRDRNKSRFLTVGTVAGPAFTAGSATVTPLARTLTLRCAGVGFSRSWPSAVLVAGEAGTSRVPIRDVTRMAQAVLMLVAMLCAGGLVGRAAKRKGRSS